MICNIVKKCKVSQPVLIVELVIRFHELLNVLQKKTGTEVSYLGFTNAFPCNTQHHYAQLPNHSRTVETACDQMKLTTFPTTVITCSKFEKDFLHKCSRLIIQLKVTRILFPLESSSDLIKVVIPIFSPVMDLAPSVILL